MSSSGAYEREIFRSEEPGRALPTDRLFHMLAGVPEVYEGDNPSRQLLVWRDRANPRDEMVTGYVWADPGWVPLTALYAEVPGGNTIDRFLSFSIALEGLHRFRPQTSVEKIEFEWVDHIRRLNQQLPDEGNGPLAWFHRASLCDVSLIGTQISESRLHKFSLTVRYTNWPYDLHTSSGLQLFRQQMETKNCIPVLAASYAGGCEFLKLQTL